MEKKRETSSENNNNWKHVLLHWVSKTGLLDRSYYNIEQTDIVEFFLEYRKHITNFPSKHDQVLLFLNEQYPDVTFRCDKLTKQLCSSEFMFAYSLLLHFCCVKYPDEYFQKICENMQESYQKAIAIFFKGLLDVRTFNKQNVGAVIAVATKENIIRNYMESPMRTPGQKYLPPTPKSNMLDEKTRELHKLKALLETEKYDKGYLELQLKQNDEKFQKLAKTESKYVAEIQELKNSLLEKETENLSSKNKVSVDKVKKKLLKDIAVKEEALINVQEKVNSITESNTLLRQKLGYAETKTANCLKSICELDCIIMDLRSVIEQKDNQIQQLVTTNHELEQIINETKSSRSTDLLNSSVECLDISLAQTPNSSGSVCTPENLGCSVIDIQLREKEAENHNLQKTIEGLKKDNAKLSKSIITMLNDHADVFDINEGNTVNETDSDLLEVFQIFKTYAEKLIEQYSNSNMDMKEMSNKNENLNSTIISLTQQIATLNSQLDEYDYNVDQLRTLKNTIEEENSTFKLRLQKLNTDVDTLTVENLAVRKDNQVLNRKISDLYEEAKNYKEEKNKSEQILSDKITEISDQLRKKQNQLYDLNNSNTDFKAEVSNLKEDVKQLNTFSTEIQEAKKDLEAAKLVLEMETVELRNMLTLSKESEAKVIKESELLIESRDNYMQSIDELKSTLSDLQKNLLAKEKEIENYCKTVEEYSSEKLQLSEEVKSLIATNSMLEVQINEFTANLDILKDSKEQWQEEKNNLTKQISQFECNLKESLENEKALNLAKHELESKYQEQLNSNQESATESKDYIDQIQILENKIIEKSSENLQIQNELITLSHDKSGYLNEITDYKAKLDSLKDDFKTSAELIDTLEEHNTNLMSENQLLQIAKIDLMKTITELTNDIAKCADIENSLKTENDIKTSQFKELEDNLDKIHAECKQQNIKIDNYEKEIIFKDNECDRLKGEIEKITLDFNTDIQQLKIKLHESNEKVAQSAYNLSKISSENIEFHRTLSNLQNNLINTDKKVRDAEGNVKQLSKDIENYESEKKVLSKEIDSLKAKILQFTDESARKENEITILKNEIAASSKQNLKLVQSFDLEVGEILVELKNYIHSEKPIDNVFNTFGSNSESNTQLNVLKEMLNSLVQIKSGLELTIEQNEEKYLMLVAECKAQKCEISDLQNNLIKAKQEDEILCQKLETLKYNYDGAVEDTKDLTEKYNHLKIERDLLEEKLGNVGYQIGETESAKQTIFEEKSVLKTKYEEALENYNAKVCELKRVRTELENTVKLSNTNLSESKNTISYYEAENKKLNVTVCELSNQLNIVNIQLENYETENLNEMISDLKITNKLIQDKYTIKETECEKLLRANNTLNNTRLTLEDDVKNYKKTIEELSCFKEKCQDLTETRKNLRQQNVELLKEIESFKDYISKLESERIELKKNSMALSEEFQRYKKEFKESKLNNVLQENANLKLELEQLESSRMDDRKQIEKIQKELISLEKRKTISEKSVAALQEEANKNQAAFVDLEEKYTKVFMEFTKLNECQHKSEKNSLILSEECEKNSQLLSSYKVKYTKIVNDQEILKASFGRTAKALEDITNDYSKLSKEYNDVKDNHAIMLQQNSTTHNEKYNTLNMELKKCKEELEKALNDEISARQNIQKLLNTKKDDDSKIRRLSDQLHHYEITKHENEILEKKNVQLTLEIGSLNKEIEDWKQMVNTEREKVSKDLKEWPNKNKDLLELNEKLQYELNVIRKENINLNENYKLQNEKLLNSVDVLNGTNLKLQTTIAILDQEKERSEKIQRDMSIFQAKLIKQRAINEENERKWLEEKEILIANQQNAEERIKANRLEMGGKLEKMKTKMKTLFNEEMTKKESKHEREIFDFQAEIQVLRGQNEKYDQHVKKLSQRVVILNEKVCELERDNKFMELKLKDYESVNTTSLRRKPPANQQYLAQSQKMLSSNLRMEDEEGEMFNNTYLTDLRHGRMSEFGGRDSVSLKEIQYRNSIAPRHLKSAYLAQYTDHNAPEEDIKIGNAHSNLDDSLISLLNTGQRKKVAGTTSYKRPGPPTPSKIAGRLSFGGSNEIHATILKEFNDNDVSATRKTPAKFKLFTSRAPKDENSPPRRRFSNLFKKK